MTIFFFVFSVIIFIITLIIGIFAMITQNAFLIYLTATFCFTSVFLGIYMLISLFRAPEAEPKPRIQRGTKTAPWNHKP